MLCRLNLSGGLWVQWGEGTQLLSVPGVVIHGSDVRALTWFTLCDLSF